MGADDANEGDGPGECLEHIWELAGVTLARVDGVTYEYSCGLCGVLLMRPPGQLTPN